MSIIIQHHDEVHFTAHAGDHQITIDLPGSHGGEDRGMNPPQLFIAAIGACVGVYVAEYCESQAITYRGMRLHLDWRYRDKPRRIGNVRVNVTLPCDSLSVEQRAGIQQSVQQCLLHNTLAVRPDFAVEVIASNDDVTPAHAR